MDIFFLPTKIRNKLEAEAGNRKPLAVLRSNGNLAGQPGEGYLAAYDNKLWLFSRAMGDDDYQIVEADYKDGINSMELRNEKFNAFLDVAAGDKTFSVKLSSFEAKDAEPVVSAWEKASGGAAASPAPDPIPAAQPATPPPVPSTTPQAGLSPIVGMAAAMMFMAATDNEIVQSEDDCIRYAVGNDKAVLKSGLDYYHNHSFQELLNALKLDRQQALCILANIMEVAMADGVLHSNQQQMIKDFADSKGIDAQEFEAVRDVLLIKNQISVLY